MIKPLIFEFQEYKEALKVARNLPYTKLPTDESSMESGHSDTDEEEQMMYQEVLYEKKAIIEGRRNLSSYTDLSSDDDDWFLAKVIGNKRQVNDKDGGSLEGEDEDTDEDGGDEDTAEDDANCEETDDSETDSSEKGEPLLSW